MRRAPAAAVVLLALGLSSCGGGGGGSPSTSSSFVSTPQLSISTTTLPGATRGQAYSATLSATGGVGTITWTATGVPAGLNLNSAGVLSGSPSSAGTALTIVVVARDSSTPQQTATANIALDIFGFNTQAFTGLANVGHVGDRLSNLAVLGGVTPVSWSIASGTAPPGMTLRPLTDSRFAFLFGAPTQTGTFNFVVRAQDASNPLRSDTLPAQITVFPANLTITTASLPHATVGQAYSRELTASGGVPPYSWSIDASSDKLPAGLALNVATGVVSGTPTTAGIASLVVRVTDGTLGDSHNYPLYVAPSPLPPRNDSLATATPIFPGSYIGSISPYGDGSAPDTDYYKMSANAGSTWHIAVTGLDKNRGNTGTNTIALDAVLEIIDANDTRLTTCNDPADDNPPAGVPITKDPTPLGYDDPCMNNGTDFTKAKAAYVDFKVPGTGLVDFYIHVFDWRGYARPDMFYRLDITAKP